MANGGEDLVLVLGFRDLSCSMQYTPDPEY